MGSPNLTSSPLTAQTIESIKSNWSLGECQLNRKLSFQHVVVVASAASFSLSPTSTSSMQPAHSGRRPEAPPQAGQQHGHQQGHAGQRHPVGGGQPAPPPPGRAGGRVDRRAAGSANCGGALLAVGSAGGRWCPFGARGRRGRPALRFAWRLRCGRFGGGFGGRVGFGRRLAGRPGRRLFSDGLGEGTNIRTHTNTRKHVVVVIVGVRWTCEQSEQSDEVRLGRREDGAGLADRGGGKAGERK